MRVSNPDTPQTVNLADLSSASIQDLWDQCMPNDFDENMMYNFEDNCDDNFDSANTLADASGPDDTVHSTNTFTGHRTSEHGVLEVDLDFMISRHTSNGGDETKARIKTKFGIKTEPGIDGFAESNVI